METTMSKSKYAHLVHEDNVVYLPGNGPSNFQFSAEREATKACEAARIRSLGYRPYIVAGIDRTGPQARSSVYGLPPSGSAGRHW
jgi:hypothetical protein